VVRSCYVFLPETYIRIKYVYCQYKRVVVVVVVVNPAPVRSVVPIPVLHYVVTELICQSKTTSLVKFTQE